MRNETIKKIEAVIAARADLADELARLQFQLYMESDIEPPQWLNEIEFQDETETRYVKFDEKVKKFSEYFKFKTWIDHRNELPATGLKNCLLKINLQSKIK